MVILESMRHSVSFSQKADTTHHLPAALVWMVLARSYRSVASFVESSVTAEQCCLSDFMVLEALLHQGALPISVLGRQVLLANASMTSVIDRLEERGYVIRGHVLEDRRLKRVELTLAGKSFITTTYQKHASDLERLMHDFSQHERTLLHEALRKLGFAAVMATAKPCKQKDQLAEGRGISERQIRPALTEKKE